MKLFWLGVLVTLGAEILAGAFVGWRWFREIQKPATREATEQLAARVRERMERQQDTIARGSIGERIWLTPGEHPKDGFTI